VNLTIVTPWLNHLELADDYFEAVLPELEDGDKVLIVDNASDPPLLFGTLTPGQNLGFARGSNLGLHAADTDAVLFLNNDVALGRRGWLSKVRDGLAPGVLVGRLRNDAHAALDGLRVPYLDGWCLGGMRSDLLSLGGFDETLEEPAYYSDNLLCLEARAAGMTLREVTVGLHHKESATSRPALNPDVRRVTLANQARYLARARELLVTVAA